jgi:hypothetical protein
MSNDSDATPTDPIAQRIMLANEAAAILAKTRRPSPFAGSPALLADEIIAMAEYLRLGDGTPATPDEYVDPLKLGVGDVIERSGFPYAIIRAPKIQGNDVSVQIRPMPGGIAHLATYSMDSTVRLISKAIQQSGEFANIFVGDLIVGDVVLDFGDGPMEAERVIRLDRPKSGTLVEVTTARSEGLRLTGTRPLPVDRQVTVRFPRPESLR